MDYLDEDEMSRIERQNLLRRIEREKRLEQSRYQNPKEIDRECIHLLARAKEHLVNGNMVLGKLYAKAACALLDVVIET